MLQKIFLTVLNMSISAGYCSVFVMIFRMFMKRMPKFYSYVLWAIVFVRLLFPVLPEGTWSFLPKQEITAIEEVWNLEQPGGIEQSGNVGQSEENWQANEEGQTQGKWQADGSWPLEKMDSENVKRPELSLANKIQTFAAGAWLVGVVILLGYGIGSSIFIKQRLKGAVQIDEEAYEINGIPTAFVTGLINPRIYLPADLPKEYRGYVLAHEKVHRQRGDVWIKFLTYVLTCIHWFNPLVWVAYILMCRDMEMSCDERVLRSLGKEAKKAYSTALLAVASGRRLQLPIPVAFSESDAKKRITNVLNYRKPAFWVTVVAFVAVTVLAVGLLSDPKEGPTEENLTTESEAATESKTLVNSESDITSESENTEATDESAEVEESLSFDESFLEQVEQWIDVAAPNNAMGFSNWFKDYAGDRWFEDYTGKEPPMFIEYNGSEIVFYPRGTTDIPEMLRKMLGVTTTVPFMEMEKYKNPMWVAEYNEEAYLLMQWKGICRLQKFEDMIQYKHKKVELEYIPIYPEDLKDQAVLSEKLSQGVNIVYLFRDYAHVNEMNPVKDAQLVFDNIRYQNTDNIIQYDAGDIIHRYFDEEMFYEFMARKAGQDRTEFLNGHNLETSWYQRVYKGWSGDSMRMEIEVTEVKWLDDSQIEIYYSGTYYDGVAVMKEHKGEMVFVSHHRIYEDD